MVDKGLKELQSQGLLEKEKLNYLPLCEKCVLGKVTRISFKTTSHQIKQTLDYVHSDLWRPSRVASQYGARCFLSILDNYYRKVWIYILKNKSYTFEKFKEWKMLVEN